MKSCNKRATKRKAVYIFLVTWIALFTTLCPPLFAAAESAPRYNFLILKSDEHNPRYSSPYGHAFVQTPNMERLAKRGTVFENAYCASPLCLPSRSAMIAGRRVFQLQTYNNCNVFAFDHPTYGALLKTQNVHSLYLGKTDVYNVAAALGFSEMLLPGDRPRPGDLFLSRAPLATRLGDAQARGNGFGWVEGNPFKGDDDMIDATLAWLDQHGTSTTPWTIDLNLLKPHFPQYVTRELWDLYADHEDLPQYAGDEESAKHPYALDLRAHFETDKMTPEQAKGLRRGYYGCVTQVDRQLGRILDKIDALGLADRTVIAYTTDHGEMLGKFGMWWKCTLYEDSVKVPLIIAGPGFTAGKRVSTPVDQLDLQAAIFRSTGATRPPDWPGQPLQDIPPADPSRAVFSEYHGHGTRGSAFMIRKGDWKLIHYWNAPAQLFNLKDDPEELHSLTQNSPEKLAELEADLRKICDPDAEQIRAEAFIQRQIKATSPEANSSSQ